MWSKAANTPSTKRGWRLASYLNRIATSVPENEVHQKFVAYIPELISDERMRKLFARLANKCQIKTRYSVMQPAPEPGRLDRNDFFKRGAFPSTAARMDLFKREALKLARKPVQQILEKLDPASITHLIVTSCTGFYAPGLDLEIQAEFGLASNLQRTNVGFMGCYAAINALKLADYIVRAEPKANVLLVNLELCTLHLQESTNPEQIMAFLQFADGCAVSLVSGEPHGLKIGKFHAEVFESGKELIQWHVGDTGFEMILSADVPKALGAGLESIGPKLMSEPERKAMKLWAIHPGGRSILDAVQAKLEIPEVMMLHSRNILRDYGNMSSATVLFVLAEMLSDHSLHGPGIAMAFGPGLTAETMRFEKALG
jgi:alpha-pyrone synthase